MLSQSMEGTLMTDKEFEALAEQFRIMPMSPYRGFGWKEGTNKIKARLQDGSWIDGCVSESGSMYVISIDDGNEVRIPKTFIHPS